MKNATSRKRLGYITEEQETAEMLQATNGGGSYTGSQDELIRYATDPIYTPPAEEYTEAAPTGTVATTDSGGQVMPTTTPTTEPAKTINWPLLIAVAVGFYLITKKS